MIPFDPDAPHTPTADGIEGNRGVDPADAAEEIPQRLVNDHHLRRGGGRRFLQRRIKYRQSSLKRIYALQATLAVLNSCAREDGGARSRCPLPPR
jgi:hypothetical protein